jgi:chromate transport protein ChrA
MQTTLWIIIAALFLGWLIWTIPRDMKRDAARRAAMTPDEQADQQSWDAW